MFYFTEYDSTELGFVFKETDRGGCSDDVLDIKMDNRSNLYILASFNQLILIPVPEFLM